MKLFCKHEWKTLHDSVEKSRYEVFTESGGNQTISLKTSNSLSRTHIHTVCCTKCGKIKKMVTEL